MVLFAAVFQIKRTEGVSTTDIVGRMLTCTRVNHDIADAVVSNSDYRYQSCSQKCYMCNNAQLMLVVVSHS
jgi:hypothetical protein